MCKLTSAPAVGTDGAKNEYKEPLFLMSLRSFQNPEGTRPSSRALIVTGLLIVGFLCAVEQAMRYLLVSWQHLHPLFEVEVNRNILARHIGVDTLSLFVVVYLGWIGSHDVWNMLLKTWTGGKVGHVPLAYENRVFQYNPAAARVILYFFAYQLKNTVDTVMWNDGPEYIVHHVLCLLTAFGAMYPPTVQIYGPFYFGVSELSTAVLCLLANFDDKHGVIGLGEAFPMTKVVLGAIFAVCFVVCRVFMWSTISFYYCRDAYMALKGVDAKLGPRKFYLQFTFVSLSLLSLLQILWLGEIVRVGQEELIKMRMNI